MGTMAKSASIVKCPSTRGLSAKRLSWASLEEDVRIFNCMNKGYKGLDLNAHSPSVDSDLEAVRSASAVDDELVDEWHEKRTLAERSMKEWMLLNPAPLHREGVMHAPSVLQRKHSDPGMQVTLNGEFMHGASLKETYRRHSEPHVYGSDMKGRVIERSYSRLNPVTINPPLVERSSSDSFIDPHNYHPGLVPNVGTISPLRLERSSSNSFINPHNSFPVIVPNVATTRMTPALLERSSSVSALYPQDNSGELSRIMLKSRTEKSNNNVTPSNVEISNKLSHEMFERVLSDPTSNRYNYVTPYNEEISNELSQRMFQMIPSNPTSSTLEMVVMSTEANLRSSKFVVM